MVHSVSSMRGEIGGGGVGLHIESVDPQNGRIEVSVTAVCEMPRVMCVVKGFYPDQKFALIPDMKRSTEAGCAVWRMEGGPNEPFFMKLWPSGGKTFQHAAELGLSFDEAQAVCSQ